MKATDSVREQTGTLAPQAVNATPVTDRDAPLNQNDVAASEKSLVQKTNEQIENLGNDSPLSGIPILEASKSDDTENDTDNGKVQVPVTEEIDVTSTSNSDLLSESTVETHEDNSSPLPSKEIKIASDDHTIVVEPGLKHEDSDIPPKIDQEISQSDKIDVQKNNETPVEVADDKGEASVNQTKQEEQKTDTSPQKEQDQLDEVKYLLSGKILDLTFIRNFFRLCYYGP